MVKRLIVMAAGVRFDNSGTGAYRWSAGTTSKRSAAAMAACMIFFIAR